MSVFHTNILAGASGASGGAAAAFQIDRSLRFNSGDSAYLSRTPSSAGNSTTFTFSCWMKGGNYSSEKIIFSAGTNSSNRANLFFSSNNLYFQNRTGGSLTNNFSTTAVFRDPSAWFHIVLSCQSGSQKIYINGVERASNTQTTSTQINTTVAHTIGCQSYDQYGLLDGYLAEVNFVDGQALNPTSFGEYDSDNVWQPKDTSGLTFGTNGFRLKFSDDTSTTTIAEDSSGNNNDWTANNITVAAVDNNWADYVYAGGSNYSSTETGTNYFTGAGSNENLFDGSTSTQVGSANVSHGWVYFRPATAITGVTSLRIWGSYNDTTKINGTDYQESPAWSSTPGWVSVPSPPSSITEIAIRGSGSAAARISAIEVNGAVLVDPTPASAIDSLIDTPMNYTAASGNNGGNYCTLNPLDQSPSGGTVSNGNLDYVYASSAFRSGVRGTIGVSSGKWYWECTIITINTSFETMIGVATQGFTYLASNNIGILGDETRYYINSGQKQESFGSRTVTSYGASFTTGDVIGVALDLDAGTITFYKNGTSQGQAFSGLSGTYHPALITLSGGNLAMNFGQRSFKYTPPSNHLAICTQNLSDPTIAKGSTAMDVVARSGGGTTQTLGFGADLVWSKRRDASSSHYIFDAIRGGSKSLSSNSNAAEASYSNWVTFNSTGYQISSTWDWGASQSVVDWVWDAGTNSSKTYTVKVVSDSGNKYRFDDFGTSAVTLDLEEGSTYVFDQSDSSNSGHPLRFSTTSNGTHGGGSEYTTGVTTTGTPGSSGAKTTIVVAASAPTLYYYCSAHSNMGGQANTNSTAGASNFDGTHQSTVRANAETGFSISTHSRTTAASISTWGHGLNAAPEFAILKPYNGTYNWFVWHKDAGNNRRFYLNSTSTGNTYGFNVWSSDSTTLGVYGTIIAGGGTALDCLTYAWAPVDQYSAFGSYEGNGNADGPFVYTGMRPAFVLVKNIDATDDWCIADTTRSAHNVQDETLFPNSSNGEDTGSFYIDILSNGFKPRNTTGKWNTSGATYIYAAFAEHPFKTARAR